MASSINHWAELSAKFRGLSPQGPKGFEGMMAVLLSRLTGKRFLVATAGRQPLGDAISSDWAISLQAKHYLSTTQLSPASVIADLIEVKDAAGGKLDVYVVAVTREHAQLRQRLEVIERDTGIDILVLEDDGTGGPLACLAVSFWESIQSLFPPSSPAFSAWILQVQEDAAVRHAVASIRLRLQTGLRTFEHLCDLSAGALAARFRPTDPSRVASGVRIDLNAAISRHASILPLAQWWQQSQKPLAYLEAEEGCGKSWITAEFAEACASGPQRSPVFWLESLEWLGSETLGKVVALALRSAIPTGDPRLEIFAAKMLRLWSRPVLIILDGVNERGCLETAQRLLLQYDRHKDRYATQVRLVFTTRPLKNYAAFAPDYWASAQRIPLGGFTAEEFDAALKKFSRDLAPAAVPANVRVIAAIPRFFHLALKLRDRLRDLGQLSKSILLFADLADKIERLDPQIKKIYPGASLASAEETLAYLARHAVAKGSTAEVSAVHMRDCFPDFTSVLSDFAEQRLVLDQRPSRVVVAAEHVELGFALHLLAVATTESALPKDALIDRLARELEPNREDDQRTEALYVATLLTFLRPAPAGSWTTLREVLLTLWAGGHNARKVESRLEFWGATDLSAYAGMVEELFARFLSGREDTSFIRPLAHRWARAGATDEAMVELLSRWLTLVYPSIRAEDSPEDAAERRTYPHAGAHQQLRLSFAALSLLSVRPEPTMLPVLARSARSCHFCRVKQDLQGKEHEFHLKSPYENFAVLMRWHYTEATLAELAQRAEAATLAERDGYKTLAGTLDLVELPRILQWDRAQHQWAQPDHSPRATIKAFKAWLENPSAKDAYWPRAWKLRTLVTHPEASATDAELGRLKSYLLDAFAESKGQSVGRDHVAEVMPDLLPWLARFSPAGAGEVAAAYWRYVLNCGNPTSAAVGAPLLPIDVSPLLDDVIVAAQQCAKQGTARHLLTDFSEIVLISADEVTVLRWLELMISVPRDEFSEVWNILPVATMIECVATPSLAAELWARFEAASQTHSADPGNREVRWWLGVYALAASRDADAAVRAHGFACILPAGHPWAKKLAQIIAACGDGQLLSDVLLGKSAFSRHFQDTEVADRFGWFLSPPPGWRLSATYQDLAGRLPPKLVAEIMKWIDANEEQLAFCRALAAAAMRAVAHTAVVSEPNYILSWDTDRKGDQNGWGIDELPAETSASHSALSSVWGVDRNPDAFREAFENRERKLQARTDELNKAIARERARLDTTADRMLIYFRSTASLRAWARTQPDEFQQFTQQFFAALGRQPQHYIELGVFCEALLAVLSEVDLEAACLIRAGGIGDGNGSVYVDGAIPSYAFQLLQPSAGGQEAATRWRKRTLEACQSDCDIMWCVLSAMEGGTVTAVQSLARSDFLTSSLAKDRALGVSILAFTGDPAEGPTLQQIADSDPVRWLRDHAEWAHAVHERDTHARRLWADLCQLPPHSETAVAAAALLALRPLLMPTALFWPRATPPTPQIAALFAAFWQDWRNRRSHQGEEEICGRKPREYCRGLKLDDVTRRMAPWWRPVS